MFFAHIWSEINSRKLQWLRDKSAEACGESVALASGAPLEFPTFFSLPRSFLWPHLSVSSLFSYLWRRPEDCFYGSFSKPSILNWPRLSSPLFFLHLHSFLCVNVWNIRWDSEMIPSCYDDSGVCFGLRILFFRFYLHCFSQF